MTQINLRELQTMPPGMDRVQAINAYIASGEEKLREARKLRDEDLRVLAKRFGPSQAARSAGVSLSTVKLAVGRR